MGSTITIVNNPIDYICKQSLTIVKEEMEAINSRVLSVLKQIGKSNRAVAEEFGISAASISHVASGRNKVGLELVQKILTHYPSISAKWLLTGDGAMHAEEATMQVELLKSQLHDISTSVEVLNAEMVVLKRKTEQLNKLLD